MKIKICKWDGSHYQTMGIFTFDGLKKSYSDDADLELNIDEVRA